MMIFFLLENTFLFTQTSYNISLFLYLFVYVCLRVICIRNKRASKGQGEAERFLQHRPYLFV